MDITHLSGTAPGSMTATIRHEGIQRRVVAEVVRLGAHWSARRAGGAWSVRCTTPEAAILVEAADHFPGGAAWDEASSPVQAPVSVSTRELAGVE
jgi:hypothetical protein